jgi:hypothetical protein
MTPPLIARDSRYAYSGCSPPVSYICLSRSKSDGYSYLRNVIAYSRTVFGVDGYLLSRFGWMPSGVIAMPGGQPLIVAPIEGPWDSPQLVNRKVLSVVFAAIFSYLQQKW